MRQDTQENETVAGRSARSFPNPSPRGGAENAEADLTRRVARSFRVSEASLLASTRASANESLARHTAMYLMHVSLGRTYAEVAAYFRRHRTSVFYACAKIEDRRDDRLFDARVARLERAIGACGDHR